MHCCQWKRGGYVRDQHLVSLRCRYGVQNRSWRYDSCSRDHGDCEEESIHTIQCQVVSPSAGSGVSGQGCRGFRSRRADHPSQAVWDNDRHRYHSPSRLGFHRRVRWPLSFGLRAEGSERRRLECQDSDKRRPRCLELEGHSSVHNGRGNDRSERHCGYFAGLRCSKGLVEGYD